MLEAASKVKPTTVRVPIPLYEKANEIVEQRLSGATSFNELVVHALRTYVRLVQRRQIDAAFAGMSGDSAYQKEAQLITSEFEESDW